MTKCARCRSSLVVETSADAGVPDLIWKCLGCGRETFVDAGRQAEDERTRQAIVAAALAHQSTQHEVERGAA